MVVLFLPPLLFNAALTATGLLMQVLMWDYVEYKLAQFKHDSDDHSNGPTAS